MEDNGATACVVTYKYIFTKYAIQNLLYYKETITERALKVMKMMIGFLKAVFASEHNTIDSPASVITMGFCMGGHMAGNLGFELQKFYRDKLAAAWGEYFSIIIHHVVKF